MSRAQTDTKDRILFDWIEFDTKPDDLHDSGYRSMNIRGGFFINKHEAKVDLHRYADHIDVRGAESINVDVTPEGTVRISPWGGDRDAKLAMRGKFFGSDAEFEIVRI
ncbi:MAG: hypothetical protein GY906_35610 [bacterium]|nr:hypothetical protein [bacterium]